MVIVQCKIPCQNTKIQAFYKINFFYGDYTSGVLRRSSLNSVAVWESFSGLFGSLWSKAMALDVKNRILSASILMDVNKEDASASQ